MKRCNRSLEILGAIFLDSQRGDTHGRVMAYHAAVAVDVVAEGQKIQQQQRLFADYGN